MVERTVSPPTLGIVVRPVINQLQRNIEQRERVENTFISIHTCELLIKDITDQSVEYSEFMKSVIR